MQSVSRYLAVSLGGRQRTVGTPPTSLLAGYDFGQIGNDWQVGLGNFFGSDNPAIHVFAESRK
jgi:hypothetical protein